MSKIPFTKPARSPEQLLEKLKTQGLEVPAEDEPLALTYLRYVGAYRLKGYWFSRSDPTTGLFAPGFSIRELVERYEFDRELRATTMESVARLEVAIRSVMANYLSLRHSPHWYLCAGIFKPTKYWDLDRLILKIEREVDQAKGKLFVKHYFAQYSEPNLPPSWSVSECVSFGFWSQTYSILGDPNDKKAICYRFGIRQSEVFSSWIHALTVIRNTAAHHSQLLGVVFGVTPKNYNAAGIQFGNPKSFFAAATIINYLLSHTGLPQDWKGALQSLFSRHPGIPLSELGFPPDWQNAPGWKDL